MKNDLPYEVVAVKQAGRLNSLHGHVHVGSALSKPIQIEVGSSKQAPISAAARHQRIVQALAKRGLKQMSAWFEAWSAVAKEGQVHLRGASSLLTWRKLLRIWKVKLLTLSWWQLLQGFIASSITACKRVMK